MIINIFMCLALFYFLYEYIVYYRMPLGKKHISDTTKMSVLELLNPAPRKTPPAKPKTPRTKSKSPSTKHKGGSKRRKTMRRSKK